MFTNSVHFDNLIDESVSLLDKRSAEIIIGRYGLEDDSEKTLAELGDVYGLTRERVRQIEFNSLKSLRDEIYGKKEADNFLEITHKYLNHVGNLRRSDLLVKDLRILLDVEDSKPMFHRKIHLLADILREPSVSREDDSWHSAWYNKEEINTLARELVSHLLKMKEHDFEVFLDVATKKFNLPETLVLNYLSISKNFAVGPYGDLGAKHWIHINPKTVRDKTYLVLKKYKAPLHFKELAKLVNKIEGSKHVHHQTVHNELIKDPRFVLVNRGTYALKEHMNG